VSFAKWMEHDMDKIRRRLTDRGSRRNLGGDTVVG